MFSVLPPLLSRRRCDISPSQTHHAHPFSSDKCISTSDDCQAVSIYSRWNFLKRCRGRSTLLELRIARAHVLQLHRCDRVPVSEQRTFVERKAGLFDLGSARCPTPFQISATGSQARTESLAESVSTSKPPEISNCPGLRFHLSHRKPPQALRLLSLWGGRTCGQSLSIEDSAQSNPKPKTNQKGFLCIKRFTSLFKVAPVHSPATISIFDKVFRGAFKTNFR